MEEMGIFDFVEFGILHWGSQVNGTRDQREQSWLVKREKSKLK
jgi:hypothetical protein